MNKQILVLSASFRKGGNSDTLCDQFIKGAVEAGNRVEKIYLNDCKINFCRGCGVCNTTHKTLIDRTVPRYEEIRNKDFYFIVAAADTSTANMQKTIQGFKGFTEDCLDGAREKGIIYGTGAWQIGDIKNSPAMNEAYEMGKNA